MLPIAKLCAAWSLLAALSFHLCAVGSGTPLPALHHPGAHQCLAYSRALLSSVTSALDPDEFGFYCTEMNVEMNGRNMSVCEPDHDQNVRCGRPLDARFNQNACLSAIKEDLQYYRDVLSTFKNGNLGAIVQQAIPELLKNCEFPVSSENSSSVGTMAPALDLNTATFYQRVHLCKILRGFRIRTITINRAMSYIAAGDHRN